MGASSPEELAAREQRPYPGIAGGKLLLAAACLAAGIIPYARWIPGDLVPLAYTALVLAFALFARTRPALRKYWELAFAFAIFGLVSVLDRFVNGYVGPSILHDPPNGGDPLASTVSGTVVIQLLDSLVRNCADRRTHQDFGPGPGLDLHSQRRGWSMADLCHRLLCPVLPVPCQPAAST